LLICTLAACASPAPVVDRTPVFYPAPPDPPRIQFLRTVSVGRDVEPGRSQLDQLLFGQQTVDKSVMAPYGSTVREGIVYVCDIQQGVVLTIDFRAQELSYLRLRGRGVLQKPVNLCFADDGRLYIADLGREQVVVLSPELQYEAEFGPFEQGSRPTGVAVRGDELFVADAGSQVVRVLDRRSGTQLRVIRSPEDAEIRMRAPTNITLDDEGTVYVVDTIDGRIHVFDSQGTFQRHIGSPGRVVGQFARPKGIAYADGLLFVIDAAFENCQIFDLKGDPLMFFGGGGVEPGSLYLPAGVSVQRAGIELFGDDLAEDFKATHLIVVTNQYGPRKINFYALGKSERFDYSGDDDPSPDSGGPGDGAPPLLTIPEQ
jgi:sugar lactone lactonase YvrE